MSDMFAVECSDGYLGEWTCRHREDAERHAKTLDGQCSCGGPHRVLANEWMEGVE